MKTFINQNYNYLWESLTSKGVKDLNETLTSDFMYTVFTVILKLLLRTGVV